MNTVASPAFVIPLIIERDDGKWSVGFDDDALGPFESRLFAEAVAAKGEGRRHALATS
jgi:hypothetical protein